MNLGLNIRIPGVYITEENQRLRMYKRVAGVETQAQLKNSFGGIKDRYGEPPDAVRNLLSYATLKLLCLDIGVVQIERKRERATMKFRENATIDPGSRALLRSGARSLRRMASKFTLKVKTADGVLQTMYDLLNWRQVNPRRVLPAELLNF